MILKLNKNYTFYLRHYILVEWDTVVLYAVEQYGVCRKMEVCNDFIVLREIKREGTSWGKK